MVNLNIPFDPDAHQTKQVAHVSDETLVLRATEKRFFHYCSKCAGHAFPCVQSSKAAPVLRYDNGPSFTGFTRSSWNRSRPSPRARSENRNENKKGRSVIKCNETATISVTSVQLISRATPGSAPADRQAEGLERRATAVSHLTAHSSLRGPLLRAAA